MKKKILIGLGILVVLLVAAFFYLDNRNRTLSPPGETSIDANGMQVSVTYSRPSVRDRMIFGNKEEGALQPYGVYWRLGANEPTFIEVNTDFTFEGSDMDAGKYVIYAIPRNGEIDLRLNTDLRFWGYSEPDYTQDVASAIVRINQGEFTEQFTIRTESLENGVNLVFNWASHQWSALLQKQ